MEGIADFLRGKILWIVISLSLAAGLIAAYGRERNAGRSPDGNWWRMRLYVIPFMAIVTAWAVSRASLTNQDAALVASILSLMGYEAVGLILTKVKKSAVPLIIGPVDEPQSRPYYSVVDTDDAGRPAAHVEITNMDKPRRTTIGRTLREIYREPEDIPDEMTAFLKQLDDQNPDDL